MKRTLILVALSLFLCSIASAFQDGGGKPTKTPTPKPIPPAAAKPKVAPHKRSSTPPVSFADLQLPPAQGMLSDFAGKLSPATKRQINTLLPNFRDRTGIKLAVVTVSFDDMQGYPIEDYALRLGRQWGIGRDSEKRALLLLVAIKPPDSQGVYHGGTRLEVSHYLEGDVPDILAGEITRKMRDDFMVGRFDQALTIGTQTILATLAQRLGISMDGIDLSQAARSRSVSPRAPQ